MEFHVNDSEHPTKYRLCIEGNPIFKERARHQTKDKMGRPLARFIKGKLVNYVRTYDPQDNIKKALRSEANAILRVNYPRFKPLTGPIVASMLFLMPIPRHWPQYKINAVRHLNLKVWHIIPPDASNLAKFYEDVFNQILWVDDSQIVKPIPLKFYSLTPKTIIEFHELEQPNWEDVRKKLKKLNM